MFFALCPGSSGLLLYMIVGLVLMALPVAVGAGFLTALVKFVRDLSGVVSRKQ